MSLPAAVLQPRRRILVAVPPPTSEQRIRRRIYLTWGLLFFNTLTYFPGVSIFPIPGHVGKAIAQLALPLALVCALSVNRKVLIRPNVFLSLVTLIALEVILTTLQPEHVGTIYRTARFIGFVACLWLLTPWWGRRDLLLLRCHLTALAVTLGSVLLGLLVAPGRSRSEGRLADVIWSIQPTQVAHYAAVMIGLLIVLWFCGNVGGRMTVATVAVSTGILLLTHTRTALLALVVGVLLAGMSLITARPRVRRLFAVVGAIAGVAALTMSAFITTWLERGQNSQGLQNLTGRTEVWGPLLAAPRTRFQEIFGFGLSNVSFDGFPIDSNWLASYQQEGLYGVVVCAMILIFMLAASYFQPRGLQRALALFLVVYALIASFTEVGFTDVSPYLMDLAVAASLLVPARERSSPA